MGGGGDVGDDGKRCGDDGETGNYGARWMSRRGEGEGSLREGRKSNKGILTSTSSSGGREFVRGARACGVSDPSQTIAKRRVWDSGSPGCPSR